MFTKTNSNLIWKKTNYLWHYNPAPDIAVNNYWNMYSYKFISSKNNQNSSNIDINKSEKPKFVVTQVLIQLDYIVHNLSWTKNIILSSIKNQETKTDLYFQMEYITISINEIKKAVINLTKKNNQANLLLYLDIIHQIDTVIDELSYVRDITADLDIAIYYDKFINYLIKLKADVRDASKQLKITYQTNENSFTLTRHEKAKIVGFEAYTLNQLKKVTYNLNKISAQLATISEKTDISYISEQINKPSSAVEKLKNLIMILQEIKTVEVLLSHLDDTQKYIDHLTNDIRNITYALENITDAMTVSTIAAETIAKFRIIICLDGIVPEIDTATKEIYNFIDDRIRLSSNFIELGNITEALFGLKEHATTLTDHLKQKAMLKRA